MLKFFRRIRQNLQFEGKTGKYLKYAIGEIILVVIGILIALSVNNWNQERINNNREYELLKNLNEELNLNISILKELHTTFDEKAKECSKGMEFLKEPLNMAKFLELNSLITTRWAVFRVNRNTYDEMLNSGSFYSLKNKMIQEAIRTHYNFANNLRVAFQEINKDGQNITHSNKELYAIEIIEDWSINEPDNLKSIDTSWFNNPNLPTFQAFYKKGKYFTNTNTLRKSMIERFIESCKNLSDIIEIKLRNQ